MSIDFCPGFFLLLVRLTISINVDFVALGYNQASKIIPTYVTFYAKPGVQREKSYINRKCNLLALKTEALAFTSPKFHAWFLVRDSKMNNFRKTLICVINMHYLEYSDNNSFSR